MPTCDILRITIYESCNGRSTIVYDRVRFTPLFIPQSRLIIKISYALLRFIQYVQTRYCVLSSFTNYENFSQRLQRFTIEFCSFWFATFWKLWIFFNVSRTWILRRLTNCELFSHKVLIISNFVLPYRRRFENYEYSSLRLKNIESCREWVVETTIYNFGITIFDLHLR